MSAVSGQQSECQSSECQSSGGQSVSCQLSDVVSADCKLCRLQLVDVAMILVPANVLTVNLTVIAVHMIVVVWFVLHHAAAGDLVMRAIGDLMKFTLFGRL